MFIVLRGTTFIGYVKGCYIGKNDPLILDIVSYKDKKYVPGVVLFIDFQKAFNTVEWDFLIDTLKKCNCGLDIKNWVKSFSRTLQAVF